MIDLKQKSGFYEGLFEGCLSKKLEKSGIDVSRLIWAVRLMVSVCRGAD